MIAANVVESVRAKYQKLAGALDERSRRRWAAVEAQALGHGGILAVCRATGLGRTAVWKGIQELELPPDADVLAFTGRSRVPGAGRKPLTESAPGIKAALLSLLEETTAGDPMSALKWTCKSTRVLADELRDRGHGISHTTVAGLVAELGYTLQANEKKREGRTHPDRDAQFRHINRQCAAFHRRGQPVVSVDTKKKELVGDFKNGGRTWRPKGSPTPVRVHDFKDPVLGKAIPYGVYDLAANAGWVNLGIDHDTAEFAVASIHQWWRHMGAKAHPGAAELLITADSGGSNGARNRLWKLSLQDLADRTGLKISVCHYPPGTSKWNKIEHRMFSHISMNWRGRPLVSHDVVVQLIGATTTRQGLKIQATLDEGEYPTKIKVTDDEMEALPLTPHAFHGNWNYTLTPPGRRRKRET
jgi:hypothetical protein